MKPLNDRVSRIEQLLPTLATKDDLRKVIEPLATRAEMHEAIAAAVAPLPTRVEMHEAIAAAVAPLPTRVEMHEAIAAAVAPLPTRVEMHEAIHEEGERTRRHFNIVAERLDTHIGLIAEGLGALREQFNEFRVEVKAEIRGLDRRLMRLEASR